MNTVKIDGMSCQHCVASVRDALEKVAGISEVSVDLAKSEATYSGEIDPEMIKQAVSSIGFEVVDR